MTEIYKFSNDLLPPIMNAILQKRGNYYSLRNPRSLVSKRKLLMASILSLSEDLKFGKIFLRKLKISDSLNLFKSNIKRYGTLTCHCKLCKSFIPCVGYIDLSYDN